jgi:hypothetical protein
MSLSSTNRPLVTEKSLPLTDTLSVTEFITVIALILVIL